MDTVHVVSRDASQALADIVAALATIIEHATRLKGVVEAMEARDDEAGSVRQADMRAQTVALHGGIVKDLGAALGGIQAAAYKVVGDHCA